MTSIKRDDSKKEWEDTEFPLVCETCLGDNPYIRMTKEPHGKACKICETPFTVFAWQAGTRGRLKRVEICRSCARAKNVCQVCIYDLQYGLPVQVRDRILAEEGTAGGGGGAAAAMAVPQSDANRSWHSAQVQRSIEQGTAGAVPGARAHLKLRSMARMEPRYERNLPKLCSFFAKGECDRGSTCPFRHEMPRDRNDPLSKQNTKDRFYGTADPVAEKMMGRQKALQRKRAEEAAARGGGAGDERAVSTLYVRYSDRGEGGTTLPPAPPLTEADVRDRFYSYGEIASVRIPGAGGGGQAAFVEYTTADATELAIASTNRTSMGNGRQIYVSWARVPKRGDEGRVQAQAQVQGGGGPVRPAAPPGHQPGGPPVRLPAGFAPVRPPAAVAAAAAARRRAAGAGAAPGRGGFGGGRGVPRPGGGGIPMPMPRPGGGPLRRPGRGGTAPARPYYASADPGRLGSHGTGTRPEAR